MKTLTKTTRTAQIKQADFTQKQTVCNLLQWTEEMYGHFMFCQYDAFLNQLFFGYPEPFLNDVKHSAIFSGFWNNEIAHRNAIDFLPFAVELTTDQYDLLNDFAGVVFTEAVPKGDCYLVDEFMFIHSAKRLMHDDDFMHRYNHTLGLIESRKNGKLK